MNEKMIDPKDIEEQQDKERADLDKELEELDAALTGEADEDDDEDDEDDDEDKDDEE